MNLFLILTGIAVITIACSMLFIGTDTENKVLNASNVLGTGLVMLTVAVFSLYVGN